MKKFITLVAGITFFCAANMLLRAGISVIPQPASVKEHGNKTIPFDATFCIVTDDANLGEFAAKELRRQTGIRLESTPITKAKGGVKAQLLRETGHTFPLIAFAINPPEPETAALGKEGYKLTIKTSPATVLVESADTAGAFYGLQTLARLFKNNGDGTWSLPVIEIADSPRFAWRGLMLDEARHFFGKDAVKQLLDVMAMQKLNTLHWHLTDDQGWRIEIKKYPKLTTAGAERAESPLPGNRKKGGGTPYGAGKFYTQNDLREIVAYAAARHITIVPEIEIPGHSSAALAAYPEFGCTDFAGYKPATATRWGVFDYLYAPKPETMQFLRDVLDEVCGIFPAEYIHIGGDEANKNQWNKSAYAQNFIKENNLKDVRGLQSYFIREAEKHLNAKGRKIIGWDEILEGGVSKNASIMAWRGTKHGADALTHGNNVVMTPKSHLYLDYGQGEVPCDENKKMYPQFEYIGGNLSLEHVYDFDPVPAGIPPELEKNILGVQGNCWSEYFFTRAKATYMIFPRAFAVAEIAWSPKEKRNFKNFEKRLEKELKQLDALKINYRKSDGTPSQPNAPMM